VLDVLVHNQPAGTLTREGREYVFTYHTDNPELFVSLTMPVRQKSYLYPGEQLHPVFNMFIPEGYLFDLFRTMLTKRMDTMDELKLLSVLAPGIRGRLTFRPWGDQDMEWFPQAAEGNISLDELKAAPDGIFERLLELFLYRSAISGAQPKVLGSLRDKTALTVDDYIIKTFGDEYPNLSENEFFCLSAARAAGIEVPDFWLSDNKRLLIIKRFDTGHANGLAMGFEEACGLMGKSSQRKYEGSYEQLAGCLSRFAAPERRSAALEQLYKTLVLSVLVRNGDAHLKNFGVLFHQGADDVRCAPAYDLVTTICYIRNDVPALQLQGRKAWWSRKKLLDFGQLHCRLPGSAARSLFELCVQAVDRTREEMRRYMQENPAFVQIGTSMLKAWETSLMDLGHGGRAG
jgi:serine/threonine-protein kinase HipA